MLDSFIREINKHWVNNIKIAERDDNDALRRQIIIDCFYGIKAISTLLHPIAPAGCEMVREYLNVDERLWSWDYIFEPLDVLMSENHELKFLEPKVDFFKKLDSPIFKHPFEHRAFTIDKGVNRRNTNVHDQKIHRTKCIRCSSGQA